MSDPVELRRNAIEIACVFDRCGATVKLLPMRIDPGNPAATALHVDEHRFEGDAPIEICPTSNQPFPLAPNVRQHLVDTARWIDERNAADRASKPIVSMRDKTAGRRPHSRTPRPTGSYWLGTRNPREVEAEWKRTHPDPPRRDDREPPVAGRNPNTPRRPLGYLGDDRYTDKGE